MYFLGHLRHSGNLLLLIVRQKRVNLSEECRIRVKIQNWSLKYKLETPWQVHLRMMVLRWPPGLLVSWSLFTFLFKNSTPLWSNQIQRVLWLKQTWIYHIWGSYHTSTHFVGQIVFKKISYICLHKFFCKIIHLHCGLTLPPGSWIYTKWGCLHRWYMLSGKIIFEKNFLNYHSKLSN